jgi:hypothetical protein
MQSKMTQQTNPIKNNYQTKIITNYRQGKLTRATQPITKASLTLEIPVADKNNLSAKPRKLPENTLTLTR